MRDVSNPERGHAGTAHLIETPSRDPTLAHTQLSRTGCAERALRPAGSMTASTAAACPVGVASSGASLVAEAGLQGARVPLGPSPDEVAAASLVPVARSRGRKRRMGPDIVTGFRLNIIGVRRAVRHALAAA